MFQRLDCDTDLPQNMLRKRTDSIAQYGSSGNGIEIQHSAKLYIVCSYLITAAIQNHVGNAFADSFLKPSGNAVIIQFFQKAACLVFQQVRKQLCMGFFCKLLRI